MAGIKSRVWGGRNSFRDSKGKSDISVGSKGVAISSTQVQRSPATDARRKAGDCWLFLYSSYWLYFPRWGISIRRRQARFFVFSAIRATHSSLLRAIMQIFTRDQTKIHWIRQECFGNPWSEISNQSCSILRGFLQCTQSDLRRSKGDGHSCVENLSIGIAGRAKIHPRLTRSHFWNPSETSTDWICTRTCPWRWSRWWRTRQVYFQVWPTGDCTSLLFQCSSSGISCSWSSTKYLWVWGNYWTWRFVDVQQLQPTRIVYAPCSPWNSIWFLDNAETNHGNSLMFCMYYWKMNKVLVFVTIKDIRSAVLGVYTNVKKNPHQPWLLIEIRNAWILRG